MQDRMSTPNGVVFSSHLEVFLPKAPCCDSAAQEG